jgi:hypothetical protein
VQSYDIFWNVVSVAYGKYVDERKLKTAENQMIAKYRA